MSFTDLQTKLNITFKNQDLLKQAFYHRSYLNEAKHIKESNERLEFLGDAILSYLTSYFLYSSYPSFPEGTLTNLRSSLVKTTTLATVAMQLEFGKLLYLSKGEEESGGRKNTSLLADSFEAFLGALYLDQGIDACKVFLTKFLFPQIESIISTKAYIDFKSFLQEVVQETTKVSPTYEVIRTEGPDHNRTFYIKATIQGKELGQGKGKSKQEAEQLAAQNALEAMGKL